MWKSSRLIYSFARRANQVTHVPPPAPMVAIPTINRFMTSINTIQIHNLVEYMTTQQLAETSVTDKLTKGLLSLLGQNLPLINLSQCSTLQAKVNAP